MAQQIQLRRGSSSTWTTQNPILAQGELGYEIDTQKFKAGDGSTAWNSLPYYNADSSFVNVDSSIVGTQDSVNFGADRMLSVVWRGASALTLQGIAANLLTDKGKIIIFNNAGAANVTIAFNDSADPDDNIYTSSYADFVLKPSESVILIYFDNGTAHGWGCGRLGFVFATQAEAEGGTDTERPMNALRVAQAIAALSPAALVDSVNGQTGVVVISASDITTGVFADAQIQQSNVTQHEGALTLAQSQITGLIDALAELESLYFGTGVDGDVTLSSGLTTLTRDMHYNNLTINGTGQLAPNGYRIYVKGILDISAAGAAAIAAIGLSGGSTTNTTAGAQAAATVVNTLDNGQRGGIGVAGAVNVGTQAASITQPSPCNGGQAGSGGAGGTGVSAGGAARTSSAPLNPLSFGSFVRDIIRGITIIIAGGGAPGGSSGGGNGAGAGGGSGGGGNGGGTIWISAATINRSASTAVATICACGGNGGNGGSPAANDRGGGGGAGGGGGGVVILFYGSLTGASATNAIDVSGGNGGTGGNALGGVGVGGNGGGGGYGGRVFVIDLSNRTSTETTGSAGTAGSAASGITGGGGGAGDVTQVTL